MKKFELSKKMLMKATKGKRVGFCNWEMTHDNFKLECWNIEIEIGLVAGFMQRQVQPIIFQLWSDGGGFTTYQPEMKQNADKMARNTLLKKGFQVDNLWTIEDVKHKYECSDIQAMEVLKDALKNDATIEQIQFAIEVAAECMNLKEKQ